jgi:LysR family transcriptional regulator, transcriptional activator of the cysJI operon
VIAVEFYQLEAFVMVAANRSFSRAAEHLYLSQPTVSAHIKTLEAQLGTPLFDRGKGELTLTTAGDVLFRYARDLLDLRTAALAEIRNPQGMEGEQLTIAASSVPCQYLLPRAIAAFEAQNKTVAVSLRQKNSRQVCEDVFRYLYPFGVVGEKTALPRLVFEKLLSDELVAAIPARSLYEPLREKPSLSLDDLARHRILLREPGSSTRAHFEKQLRRAGFNPDDLQITVYDTQETIKQAVRQGVGLTVISRYVVEDYEEFGLLFTRPVAGMKMERDFWLVYHEKRVLTPASRALLAHLVNFFPQEDRP